MICSNCNSNDWENVDWARFKELKTDGSQQGMSLCRSCGNISYPSKWQTKEAILEHYRKDYRNPPTAFNSFTGIRKNYFHLAFLKDLFEEWKASGLKNPKICEIGAAYGMTLGMIGQMIPGAELHGTEITTSYKRNAYHEFGIELTDDIDESKKYDLIITYKVLEHQLDPHLELERYSKLLTENGRLYISVPTWLNSMNNFGLDGFDLEYYYDPNHVNVWTRPIFENILTRSGFEVLKEDHIMYSDTYLCKTNESLKSTPVYKENIDDVKLRLKNIKDAYLCILEQKYEEAIKIHPEFPFAHISNNEMKRKLLTEKGWDYFHENHLKKAIDACPNSPELYISATDFAMRALKFQTAIEYANKALIHKPNNPASITQLINIFKEIAIRTENEKEKIGHFKQAKHLATHLLNTSLQSRDEAVTQIYYLNSMIPIEEAQ